MNELSNFEIDGFFKDNPWYGGCMSKDDLRGTDRKFYVLNLGKPRAGGTHWVLMSMLAPVGIYFDNFAVHPPPVIETFMKRFRVKNVMNTNIVQDIRTSSCGYFAIYVADQLCRGRFFTDIVDDFDGVELNEKRIQKWWNKYLKKSSLYRDI